MADEGNFSVSQLTRYVDKIGDPDFHVTGRNQAQTDANRSPVKLDSWRETDTRPSIFCDYNFASGLYTIRLRDNRLLLLYRNFRLYRNYKLWPPLNSDHTVITYF